MLTDRQIQSFKRDGVLVLRRLFLADEIAAWRSEVLEYFEHPQSPDDWRGALRVHKSDDFRLRCDPTPSSHPALREVYGSLHASARWAGENELLLRPGHEPVPWLGARAPHLDFPFAAPIRTLANFVLCLSDVRERGGAFMYWPGSHRISWNYFHQNPDDYLSAGDRSQDQTFAILRREMVGAPVEFIADAGDVLIWHSLTFHSASVNTRAEPRIAIFGRWGVALGDEPIYDFGAEMWRYWAFDAGRPNEAPNQ